MGFNKYLLLLVISVLTAFSFAAYKRISVLKSGEEFGVDAFYHTKMADGGPFFFMKKTFPHTQKSIWKDNFYDKELMFHMTLWFVRSCKKVSGFSLEPPFHISSLFFILINLLVVAFLSYKIIPRYAFFFPVLYIIAAPGFTNRLMMLRPHHLSIILLILTSWYIQKLNDYKRLWIPFIFSVLFVYSYSNPHFVLVPVILYSFFLVSRKKYKLAVAAVSVSICSLFLAMLIHPQSPNTFILWKVQCYDLFWEMITAKKDIGIADELRFPGAEWLLFNYGVILLVLINISAICYIAIKGSFKKLGRDTLFFAILQTLFTVGILFNVRPIEYAVPFSIFTAAMILRDIKYKFEFDLHKSMYKPAVAVLIVFSTILLFSLPWISKLQVKPKKSFREYGQWAEKKLPVGTLVANIGWGDFTRLFFSAPHCRYLFALDPMFAYAFDPEFTLKMRRFHKGEYIIYPKEMRQITGADFAFIGHSDASELRRARVMVEKLGYKPVYIGKDGSLFDLR